MFYMPKTSLSKVGNRAKEGRQHYRAIVVSGGDGGHFQKVKKFLLPTKILSKIPPHPPH
jgi:hypothetical protein